MIYYGDSHLQRKWKNNEQEWQTELYIPGQLRTRLKHVTCTAAQVACTKHDSADCVLAGSDQCCYRTTDLTKKHMAPA